jgi:hypothetical protein
MGEGRGHDTRGGGSVILSTPLPNVDWACFRLGGVSVDTQKALFQFQLGAPLLCKWFPDLPLESMEYSGARKPPPPGPPRFPASHVERMWQVNP